ncbi:MAG: CBS domain-containing protein [Acidobacteria bacterium]|nr:CBS domain-containing protein [Acidobacteriota bacterium]MCI0723493.1 CBS domain-containing protein [Acidobacteriota bacterium]
MSIGTVLRQRTIRQLDLSPFLVVDVGSSLRHTLLEMRSSGSGAALVTENQRLAGIFTERDLISRVVGCSVDDSKPVRDFMTPNPAVLRPEASVFEALQLMGEHGYRNIPVVEDDGRLAGSLPVSKVVEFLAESFPQEVLALPPRADQSFTAADGA